MVDNDSIPATGGWSSVPNWVMRSDTLKTYEKLVYISLLNRADSYGRCFPSIALIAADCAAAKGTIRTAIDRLVELRLVTVTGRKRDDDPRVNTSNSYQINPWRPQALEGGSRDEGGWSNSCTGVVQEVKGGGSTDVPEVLPIEGDPLKGERAREIEDPDQAPPKKLDEGDEAPSPFCERHPDGTEHPCVACMDARKDRERWDKRGEQRKAETKTTGQAFTQWARNQPDCPHGVGGGDLDRPDSGTPSCVACRNSRKSGLSERPPDHTLPDCPHGMPGGDWLTTSKGEVRCFTCRIEGNRRTTEPHPDQSEAHLMRDWHKEGTAVLQAAKMAREERDAEADRDQRREPQ